MEHKAPTVTIGLALSFLQTLLDSWKKFKVNGCLINSVWDGIYYVHLWKPDGWPTAWECHVKLAKPTCIIYYVWAKTKFSTPICKTVLERTRGSHNGCIRLTVSGFWSTVNRFQIQQKKSFRFTNLKPVSDSVKRVLRRHCCLLTMDYTV